MSHMEQRPRKARWLPFSKVPTAGTHLLLEFRWINLRIFCERMLLKSIPYQFLHQNALVSTEAILLSRFSALAQHGQEVSCLLGLHTAAKQPELIAFPLHDSVHRSLTDFMTGPYGNKPLQDPIKMLKSQRAKLT